MFCREVYYEQETRGRNAHLEQPKDALSWSRPAWQGMKGFDAILDQCACGRKAYDGRGRVIGPIKKPTRIRTTKRSLALNMARRCRCLTRHVPLEGKYMKGSSNYPWEMAKKLAKLMLEDDEPSEGYAMEYVTHDDVERMEYSELYAELKGGLILR